MRTRDIKHGAIISFKNNPEWGKYVFVKLDGNLVFVSSSSVCPSVQSTDYPEKNMTFHGNVFED